MSNYKEKVQQHFNELSIGMKKVAKHLLDKPESFAMQSAGQVGKEIGVSETTVIRLCYALEYQGYSQLQKELRNQLINSKSSLYQYQTDKKEMANESNFYEKTMLRDQLNIQKILQQVNQNDIQSVVNRLIDSNTIYVSGQRTSFSVAHWFSFTLNLIRGNASLVQPGMDDIPLLLHNISKKSTFIGISFHRYAKETINLAKAIKDRGGFVVGITDSLVAPITEFSDIVLPISFPVKSTIDAGPALLSLMNALVAGVSIYDPEGFQKRREEYEALYLEDLFFT